MIPKKKFLEILMTTETDTLNYSSPILKLILSMEYS